MRIQILLPFFCIFILSACSSSVSNKGENNSHISNIIISDAFSDSGSYINGVKAGRWIEYTVDTVQAQSILIIEDGNKREGELKQTIIPQKELGNYENGLRVGKWTKYSVLGNTKPFDWYLIRETDFVSGKKNGLDISFGLGGDTSTIATYVDGQEFGLGKLFYPEHSNKIWKVYIATKEDNHLLKEFYPSGQIKTEVKEVSGAADQKLFEIIKYFENGKASTTGQILENEERIGKWILFYENGNPEYVAQYKDGAIDGITRYYHDNGQLWTEQHFIKGKLWEVISNYDR